MPQNQHGTTSVGSSLRAGYEEYPGHKIVKKTDGEAHGHETRT